MVKLKKNQLRKEKKLDSIKLNRQTRDPSHETIIIL
jgi:hypothetical protein